MTEWALIIMLCGRTCVPQYVEVFPTKAACEVNIQKPSSGWSREDRYCVPVIKSTK